MKSKLTIVVLLVSISFVKAQIYTPSGIVQGSSGNNNIGIGTSNPNSMLTLGGSSPLFLNRGASSSTPFLAVLNSVIPTDAKYGWAFYDNSTNGNLDIFRRNGTSQGIQFMSFNRNTGDVAIGESTPLFLNHGASSSTPFLAVLNSVIPTSANYGWAFYDNPINGNLDIFRRNGTVQGLQFMSFDRNTGDVSIGTSNSNGNKLAVKGIVGCEEVVVKSGNSWNWPDYVFAKDYKLKSLKEVKEYIEQNNHLPEIPSAQEIEKNGINLGEMNAKLLQKIEELTLYVIEQNKQITNLQNRLDKVESNSK